MKIKMDLMEFMDEESKQKILNSKSEVLKSKHEKVEELSKEMPVHQAEMKIYNPQKLEKISFGEAEKDFGLKQKICFFVSKEELMLIEEKWKIMEQFDEKRIASRDLNRFVQKIIE